MRCFYHSPWNYLQTFLRSIYSNNIIHAARVYVEASYTCENSKIIEEVLQVELLNFMQRAHEEGPNANM